MFQPFDLPVLGLGVSLSLGEKPSPLSLYENTQYAFQPQFIEYAGLCDVNLLQEQLQFGSNLLLCLVHKIFLKKEEIPKV